MDTCLLKELQQFPDTSTSGAAVNNANEKVIFKSCASFTSCITKINNTKVDNAGDFDIIMPMYNMIEFSIAYSKTSGRLWQYYRDQPALHNNNSIIDFPVHFPVHSNLNNK